MNIFAELTEKTPVLTQLAGRELVKNYGDVQSEYEALRTGAIVYDCGTYGIYSVSGEEASDFLERLSTKDVLFMNVGGVTESYFLDDNADIVGAVFIAKREDDFLVITFWEFATSVLVWMTEKKSDFISVTINDLTESVSLISFEGCKSWKLVKDLFSTEIENIALQTIRKIDYMDDSLSILRIGRTSEYGYLVLSKPLIGESIYKNVLAHTNEFDFPIREGGIDCIEIAMLEVHQPNFSREMRQFGNIFELSQQWYLSYDKENYYGYDTVKKILENKIENSAVCFILNDVVPISSGTSIFNDVGETVGKVVYSLHSPKLNEVLGIAVMQEPYGQSGLIFSVAINGVFKEIKTVSAPIVRPLSWDVKME